MKEKTLKLLFYLKRGTQSKEKAPLWICKLRIKTGNVCHLPAMGLAHQNAEPQRPVKAHQAIPKVENKDQDRLRQREELKSIL